METAVVETRIEPTSQDRFHRASRLSLLAIGFGIAAGLSLPLDSLAAWSIRQVQVPGDLRRGLGLCESFAHSFGIAMILFCIFVTNPGSRRYMPRVLAFALVPGILVNAVKLLVVRWRPIAFEQLSPQIGGARSSWVGIGDRFGDVPLDNYLSQSFPSGHAATAVGFAIGLSWLFPRGRWAFAAIALLAMFQRIVSDAHWVSDTLIGASTACLVGAVLVRPGWWSRGFDRIEARRAAAASLPQADRPGTAGSSRAA